MQTLTLWRARRAALSSLVVGTLLLAGAVSPAAASVPASAPAPADTRPQAPGPEVERRLDPTADVTARALAITKPTRTADRGGVGIAPQAEGGLIRGSISDWDGNILPGVLVSVYSAAWDGVTPYAYTLTLVQTVETDATGYYQVTVQPGYYKIFFDPVDDPDSAWQWDNAEAYPGAYATSVNETGWQASVSLPVAHGIGGAMTGGPTTTALTGAPVTLWAGEWRTPEEIYFSPVWDVSSTSGRYDFSQLPEGFYLVEVKTLGARYLGEWWNNRPDFDTSDIIDLWLGDTVANVHLSEYAQVLPALAVAGTPAVGNTVTISVPTKVAGATYSYYWYADGVAIAGSAGKTSFTITAAQQGKQLSAKVTVAKTGYLTAARTTPRTTRVIAHSAPTITGSVAVGYTLTANPNVWTPGTTFTYQWYANGVAITGAKAAKYKLALAERDKNITVRAWGTNPGYTKVSRGSVATAKVAQVAKPVITGTPKVGQQLTAATAGWTPGTTFKFQWYAGGVAISGAVSYYLNVASAQMGKAITVKATGSKTGYITYTQTSLPTALVVR